MTKSAVSPGARRMAVRLSLLSATTLMMMGAQAHAAGFYIQEQSVRGLGSAFSGSTTTLNDPSVIYFNPGGMTQLQGLQMQAGANLLIPDSKVKNNGSTAPAAMALGGASGNPYDPTPIPNGYVSYQASDRIWLGLGVSAPYGLGSDYGDTWFGRFDSTKTELAVIDIQPTIAFKVNDWFSFGVGANIAHSNADLRNKINLSAVGGGEGSQKLTGDDWAFGYTIGLQFRPLETTTIGVSYKSAVHHDLDGKLEIRTAAGGLAPAPFPNGDGRAKLTTPDHAIFGLAHQVTDRLTLQGQATWFGWNNFDNITVRMDNGTIGGVVPQGYQTTWAFAVGAEYVASDKWTVRGGVQFDETPTTDLYRTSRTPDGDRTWLSMGGTYKMSEKIDLDFAGTYIFVEDGNINLQRGPQNPINGAGAGNFRAKTEGNVAILALGMTYKF